MGPTIGPPFDGFPFGFPLEPELSWGNQGASEMKGRMSL